MWNCLLFALQISTCWHLKPLECACPAILLWTLIYGQSKSSHNWFLHRSEAAAQQVEQLVFSHSKAAAEDLINSAENLNCCNINAEMKMKFTWSRTRVAQNRYIIVNFILGQWFPISDKASLNAKLASYWPCVDDGIIDLSQLDFQRRSLIKKNILFFL